MNDITPLVSVALIGYVVLLVSFAKIMRKNGKPKV